MRADEPEALVGAPVDYEIGVEWEGGMRYRGGGVGGPTLLMDGRREVAPSPVDSLLVALAACSAIDVVEILGKQRTPVTTMSIRVRFSRAVKPPRRLTAVHLVFAIGTAAERVQVDRAITLSMDKYCSVATSLASDMEVTWDVVPGP
jgi:putative redox protein